MDAREFLRWLERSQQRSANEVRQWLLESLETREQKEQREAAEAEERRRRVLARIGYTPETFEAACAEFSREFYGGGK